MVKYGISVLIPEKHSASLLMVEVQQHLMSNLIMLSWNGPISSSIWAVYPVVVHVMKISGIVSANITVAFTARRYASAVLAVIVCPSVCLSVCHKSELYKDG